MLIQFTADQQKIVDYIFEQVSLGEEGQNIVISGIGGSGKSELICEVICELLKQGKKVAAGAMTGKATAVLRSKITKKLKEQRMKPAVGQLLVETIAKLTKVSKVLGITEEGETQFTNKWRDPTNFDYDVLVVDELSMVPSYVQAWWSCTKALVIGLGDYCQLPEVLGEDVMQEVNHLKEDLELPDLKLQRNYGIRILHKSSRMELTEVLRSDNDIALLCRDIRNFDLGKSQLVKILRRWAKRSNDIEYSTHMEDLETSRDWQIICYTNEMCRAINNRLCIGGDYPSRNDKVLLFDNIQRLGKYNGDIMVFEDLVNAAAKLHQKHNEIFVCFKWQGKMPKKNSKFGIERQSYETFTSYKNEYRNIQARRLNQLPQVLRDYKQINPELSDEIDTWLDKIIALRGKWVDPIKVFPEIMKWFEKNHFEVLQYLMSALEKLPQLYLVNLDYGYAITTHKSQGSEYENVCYVLERFDKPLVYTGLSRAKKKLKIIDLTGTIDEEVM